MPLSHLLRSIHHSMQAATIAGRLASVLVFDLLSSKNQTPVTYRYVPGFQTSIRIQIKWLSWCYAALRHFLLHLLSLLSHPDYTVGFGISPNHASLRAGYTAGGESHPAPSKYLFTFNTTVL